MFILCQIVSEIIEKGMLKKHSEPFALSTASKNGRLDVVKVLINSCHEKMHGLCLWPEFSEYESRCGVVENAVHQAIDADQIEIMQCLLASPPKDLKNTTNEDQEEKSGLLGGMTQAVRILEHTVTKDAPAMTYALLEVFPQLLDYLDKQKLDKQADVIRRRVRYCLWHNNLAHMRGQPPHRPDVTATCFKDLHIQPGSRNDSN